MRRAVQARFVYVDDLSHVWVQWAEMEVRHNQVKRALEVLMSAVEQPIIVSGRMSAEQQKVCPPPHTLHTLLPAFSHVHRRHWLRLRSRSTCAPAVCHGPSAQRLTRGRTLRSGRGTAVQGCGHHVCRDRASRCQSSIAGTTWLPALPVADAVARHIPLTDGACPVHVWPAWL